MSEEYQEEQKKQSVFRGKKRSILYQSLKILADKSFIRKITTSENRDKYIVLFQYFFNGIVNSELDNNRNQIDTEHCKYNKEHQGKNKKKIPVTVSKILEKKAFSMTGKTKYINDSVYYNIYSTIKNSTSAKTAIVVITLNATFYFYVSWSLRTLTITSLQNFLL